MLYVACTRARDHLLVTSVDPASVPMPPLAGSHAIHTPLKLTVRTASAAGLVVQLIEVTKVAANTAEDRICDGSGLEHLVA